MGKNIVVCCDGTANEFARNNTNVVKLYSTLVHEPGVQVTYYHPGLGTMEPAGALTTFARKATKVLGMAMGYGLENDIRDAYIFLMRNYQAGDRVFLFGFSRGAYTVRGVASLLHMYGLIRYDNEALVPYAIRMLMGLKRGRKNDTRVRKSTKDYFELARTFKKTMSRADCRPLFVGVWDTVSSVGWVENPLKLPYVSSNPSIDVGRHAIAIDERRAFFRSHLWRPDGSATSGPKDLKQVWFAGVHCDVGGGYEESKSGLSKITLQWMLKEAKACGLLIDPVKEMDVMTKGQTMHPDADAHESLKGWWHLAELFPKRHWNWEKKGDGRRPNLWRRRTIPEGSDLHTSVEQRGGGEYFRNLSPRPANVRFVD